MARKMDIAAAKISAERPNEPPADDAVTLPANREEAIRWVYAQAIRIGKDRAWQAEKIKEAVTDAKAHGAEPRELRLAARLERMTPEMLKRWEDQINGAAKYLGYSPLELTDMPEMTGPKREALNVVVHLEAEKAKNSEKLADIFAAAAAVGDPEKPGTQISVRAIRQFLKMSGMDEIEVSDWFDEIDMIGKTLGRWVETDAI